VLGDRDVAGLEVCPARLQKALIEPDLEKIYILPRGYIFPPSVSLKNEV